MADGSSEDSPQQMNETTDAVAILSPLWTRKWLILAVGVVVALASYAYYNRKPPIYKASTELYIGGSEEQEAFANQTKAPLSDRTVIDQATLINSNVTTEAVRRQLRGEHRLIAAKGKALASATSGSDFITITAEAGSAKGAAELANAYATAFVMRQSAHHRAEVEAAIARTRRQLRAIETSSAAVAKAQAVRTARTGSARSPAALSSAAVLQEATLDSKIDQLESGLAAPGIEQISPAKPARSTLVSPKPKRNAIFGFIVGILLAAFAAYALARLDRRLRSLADVEAIFGAQILAALPSSRHPIVSHDGAPAPAEELLEPLRRLHTTLQLGDMLEHDRERTPRVILLVSADAGDGKSTLIANLALVQRDAGERVAVVEADLRRPVQAQLLRVERGHGLVEVLSGMLPAGEVLQRAPGHAHYTAQAGGSGPSESAAATLVGSAESGSLSVLVAGASVANPPALLARPSMTDLLRSLAEERDHVLVDAPSPLEVSDVMPLLQAVDGILLVARIGHTRRATARRLGELLARVASAPVLGVVANCASARDLRANGMLPAAPRRGLVKR